MAGGMNLLRRRCNQSVAARQRVELGAMGLDMLIFKGLSAVAAAALGAAAVLALPGFSPDAEAITPPAGVKADRIDARPLLKDCSQQAWPYYEARCLRDHAGTGGAARPIRVIAVDRLAAN